MTSVPRARRILVLGGYGVFGRRAVERLAREPGLAIIVAGRNETAARQAADAVARLPSCRAHLSHAALDATSLTAGDLTRLDVGIVLTTAGPFQQLDYRLPRAAIDARAHYIDIADARGFVAGIGHLDGAARAAGVLVVGGASSVPALAAAVIDRHLPRFSRLTDLRYGISPGNSFDPGIATTASVLASAGQPFTTLIDGGMTNVRGWQPLDAHTFRDTRVATRWLGHCEVPDLDLFPKRYVRLETQTFVAGVEVKAFHFGLWALSWLVRAGVVRGPGRFAGTLLSLKRHLGVLGSDRGAMFVTLAGRDWDDRALRIAWELIADGGDGPNIPITPAVILAKKLARGTLERRGAMPCLDLLTLEEFSGDVADLAIRHDCTETRALYRRALGEAFDALPAPVRDLHELAAKSVWAGEADVTRGRSLLSRIAGWIAGLPRAGNGQPLTVAFTTDGNTETWQRDFSGSIFRSRQSLGPGNSILERVGPALLMLRPTATADGLVLSLDGMRVFGMPVPRALLPRVATREHVDEADRYRFEVTCDLPIGGPLVRYSGWLARVPVTRAPA